MKLYIDDSSNLRNPDNYQLQIIIENVFIETPHSFLV